MGAINPGINIFANTPPLTEAQTTGRVFFVGSTAVPGGVVGVNASGAYGNTPQRPFLTFDYAQGECTANRSDTVYGLPGHAETVAGTIAVDVAGVRNIGLGIAANRPVFTFDTTTDVVAISAANCEWANMEHVCNVASHTRMVDLQGGADGAKVHHNMFREGTATGLSMVEWTGAADDVWIYENTFYAPTAGNYDEAILIASTPTRGHIINNLIFGDWDEGGINNAAANVATLFEIGDNKVVNLLTGVGCIVLVSAVTGVMWGNRVANDTLSAAIDPGSMRCWDNKWTGAAGTDQFGVDVPGPAADTTQANSILGVLMGTGGITTFPTGAAYANGVSLAEVIAYIQDGTRRGTGTILPANTSLYDLSERVITNAAATLVTGTTIFTIAGGPIEILSLVARCVTGNDATGSTLQWSADPTDGAAVTFSGASVSLASALAGAMVVLQGTTLATAPVVNASGVGLGQGTTQGIVVGAGVITTTVGVGSTTGTWMHHMRFRALANGVTVT